MSKYLNIYIEAGKRVSPLLLTYYSVFDDVYETITNVADVTQDNKGEAYTTLRTEDVREARDLLAIEVEDIAKNIAKTREHLAHCLYNDGREAFAGQIEVLKDARLIKSKALEEVNHLLRLAEWLDESDTHLVANIS